MSRRPPVYRIAHRSLATVVHVALCAALVSPLYLTASVAHAQTEQRINSFNIPSGPLGSTLTRIAEQSGVLLTFDPALVEGQSAAAVNGEMTAEQALQRALQDSGLEVVAGSDGGYRVQRVDSVTLAPVKVSAAVDAGSVDNAYRVESAAVGALGKKTLQNTPYSIEVFSRELMNNQQARSISDVTKTDASVTLSAGDLMSENNAMAIRGLSPDFDTGQKLDGLNLRSRAADLPLEHVEIVEILKGASGFLYGFGAPGGIINYTLKRPTTTPTRMLNAQVTDSGLWLLHGDLGQRFGDEERFGYRFNVVHESGETYIDDGESKRGSASLALDWRITPDLVWQIDMLEASHKRYGGYWAMIPNADGQANNWETGKPLAPIDGDRRLAPEWTRYGSEHETWGTDIGWQMSDDWLLKVAYRASDSYRLFYSPALFTDADGNYSAFLYNYNNHFESEQAQALLLGELQTGSVRHELVAGVSRTETVSSNAGALGRNAILGSGNLSDPVEFAKPFAQLSKSAADEREYSRVERSEWFLSDTLHIGDQWDLIAGARYGNLQDKYADYDESEITPTLAVIYRPMTWMSLYASYVEAFEAGATAPGTATNASEVFDPLVSEQQEAGIKIGAETWSVNAALFQLRRGLTYTTANNVFTQDGEARYEGAELSGKARLGARWLVVASALWMDARNEKAEDIRLEGERIQGVARNEFRLYGEYSVPATAVTLSAGAQYVGKRPIDPNGQWSIGSVTLFDIGARYETRMADLPLVIRLNVDNLMGEDYWLTSPGGGDLMQGAPRTVKLGAQLDF